MNPLPCALCGHPYTTYAALVYWPGSRPDPTLPPASLLAAFHCPACDRLTSYASYAPAFAWHKYN